MIEFNDSRAGMPGVRHIRRGREDRERRRIVVKTRCEVPTTHGGTLVVESVEKVIVGGEEVKQPVVYLDFGPVTCAVVLARDLIDAVRRASTVETYE